MLFVTVTAPGRALSVRVRTQHGGETFQRAVASLVAYAYTTKLPGELMKATHLTPPPAHRAQVLRALEALGGEGTLGDLLAITGLPRKEVAATLETLIAEGPGHVRVSESGDVVYHLVDDPSAWRSTSRPASGAFSAADVGFDRKTVQLIRAREGVLCLAELVEHTGLPLADARVEMHRLADRFGGIARTSLDGHVVHAFPELMTSAHGRWGTREPRPAWIRGRDPIRASRGGRVAKLIDRLLPRLRRRATIRRWLLGLVIQTALAGRGVVSLGRAVAYLEARAGRRAASRRVVERALRDLAAEFEAPVTELSGDVFFGFRNIKRQFLASHLVRRQLQLGRTVWGRTIFDTADPPLVAAERELEAFDRSLAEGRPMLPSG